WQQLLKVTPIGIHDNFFELGGHSLMAMQIKSSIERELLISIPIQVLFQFTSISDLSKYLEVQRSSQSNQNDASSFRLLNI
ncbi:phosphopantetheine-binding protein, partial [Chitinophagaceae bacterium LB-8]